MNRVDPLLPVQVNVVGPGEEPHDAVLVIGPDAEGELEGCRVDIDVVVADQNGVGFDVVWAGEEAEVEAA